MDNYNLEQGERTIKSATGVYLQEGPDERQLDEIVLTNRHFILVTSVPSGILKRERYLMRCPLDEMVDDEGVPQAWVSEHKGRHYLQAAFGDEAISLRFQDNTKSTAARWAEALKLAAVGDFQGIRIEDPLPPEFADLVGDVRYVAGALFGTTAAAASSAPSTQPRKKPKPKAPTRVTKKCTGCHAPLAGMSGTLVTCPYCDMKQTL